MEQNELLRTLVEALEDLDVRYALAGSIASTVYGEPRSTRDIDVVAALEPGDVRRLAERLTEPEHFLDPVAARQAVREEGPFNILHVTSGMKIDVFPPVDRLARRQIEGAVRITVEPDLRPRFSPPAELILQKLRYYREGGSDKHLRDIAAMLQISGERIDRSLVSEWAREDGTLDLWREILERVEPDREG